MLKAVSPAVLLTSARFVNKITFCNLKAILLQHASEQTAHKIVTPATKIINVLLASMVSY